MTDEEMVETAMVPAPEPDAAAMMTLHGSGEPNIIIQRATEQANALARVIQDRQLFQQIRDRRHVNVEGWTTLGALLGVFPVVVWSRRTEDFRPRLVAVSWEENPETGRKRKVTTVLQDGAGGWEARVEARTLDGKLVGAAEAECRYDESTWSTRDSYALRSMAQTRATSKALRLPLGFIMSLAGFDPSPEEEMPGSKAPTFDLHRPPDDRRPIIWSKQVAAYLFADEGKDAAADAWRTAVELEGLDPDDQDWSPESAQAVVMQLHAFIDLEGATAAPVESPEEIEDAEIVPDEDEDPVGPPGGGYDG